MAMAYRRAGGRIVAPVLSSLVLLFIVSRRPFTSVPERFARSMRDVDPGVPLDLRSTALAGFDTAVFPIAGEAPPPALEAFDACEICYCPFKRFELTRDYRTGPQLSAELSVGGPVRDVDGVGRILRSIQLSTYCPSVHVHNASITETMLKAPPADTLAFNVSSLSLGRPTLYWMTKTTPSGKLTSDTRLPYFQRHVSTIFRHRERVAKSRFSDGTRADARQLLWILVEDSPVIDQNVVRLLQESGLAFVYFALGVTHRYGNAQQVRLHQYTCG